MNIKKSISPPPLAQRFSKQFWFFRALLWVLLCHLLFLLRHLSKLSLLTFGYHLLVGLKVSCEEDLVRPASLVTESCPECVTDSTESNGQGRILLDVELLCHGCLLGQALHIAELLCDLEHVGVHWDTASAVEREEGDAIGHFVTYSH